MASPQGTEVMDGMAALGWTLVPVDAEVLGPLSCVLESTFAVVALITDQEVFARGGAWRRAQVALADLVSAGRVQREKDRYLVFVLDEVRGDDVAELEAALADTHVARKLCVETRGTTVAEALGQSVVLAGPRIVADSEPGLSSHGVPDKVLEDLGQRGVGLILDRLLSGAYNAPDEEP